MQRRVGIAAVTLALVLAACGGTDFNAATNPTGKTLPTPNTAKVAHAIATEAAAERPLIAALVASDKANNPDETPAERAATRCLATAIVSGYGSSTLISNGLDANALRSPKSTLDPLPDPIAGQVTSIGAAIQRCHIDEFGHLLAANFGITDAPTIACLSHHLETDAAVRRYLVITVLARHVGLDGAHQAVGVVSECADLATIVLDAAKVPPDPTTRACIVDAMNGTSAALKDYFALRIAGTNPDAAQQAIDEVGVAVNRCRPSAHTGFTVPSG